MIQVDAFKEAKRKRFLENLKKFNEQRNKLPLDKKEATPTPTTERTGGVFEEVTSKKPEDLSKFKKLRGTLIQRR